jgi:4a-hydroxytetrahydrobiopterin dehydratase
MKANLSSQKCQVCEVGGLPLSHDEAQTLLKDIKNWTLSDDRKSISKKYFFKDFTTAFDFAEKVKNLAESEGHHPDLLISWGRVEVKLFTHAVNGLSMNDFIMAAKIDEFE